MKYRLDVPAKLGSTVYVVDTFWEEVKNSVDCGCCGGLGEIKGKDKKTYPCMHCYGKGKIDTSGEVVAIQEYKVDGYTLSDDGVTAILCLLGEGQEEFKLHEFFISKEDAQKEYDRLIKEH